jgi:hypothetical protein
MSFSPLKTYKKKAAGPKNHTASKEEEENDYLLSGSLR